MKRIIPAVIAVVMLWLGCTTATEKRYYQLHISPPPQPISVTPFPGTILVSDAMVDQIYEGYRLIYRLSPYQLDFYNYEYWIKKPSQMIREALINYLNQRNVFARVIQSAAEAEPDWVLHSRLNAIEECDQRDVWFARLSMSIRITTHDGKRVLAEHRFDRMDRLARRDSRLLPRVLSRILQTEMDKVVEKLRRLSPVAD
ncbi:MAG TPA: hypothetical protein ENN40_10135 [Candidatus Aminicenantes bacterium]|nr:hypothetical protein [Candidatus Aminicenantes bacterium]